MLCGAASLLSSVKLNALSAETSSAVGLKALFWATMTGAFGSTEAGGCCDPDDPDPEQAAVTAARTTSPRARNRRFMVGWFSVMRRCGLVTAAECYAFDDSGAARR